MSRRRHTADVVLHSTGWALERLLTRVAYCPECAAWGKDMHRPTCEVARALKLYQEWRDIEARPRPPLVGA